MKNALFCFAIISAFVSSAINFGPNNSAFAQSWNTTPNAFGGGTTTTGPGGTYRTTPNAFGGGYTTTGPSGTYRTTPNAFGGGTTTTGPSGTYRTTPNAFGGGYTTRRQTADQEHNDSTFLETFFRNTKKDPTER